MPLLSLEKTSKNFRVGPESVHAVAEVSLIVNAGEFLAVQGPSGCGKSTLLLVAGGLLPPDAGVARVLGEDIFALGAGARSAFRAAHIGFVFQRFHLIPYLSVLDNVLAPSLATPIPGARARARQLLENFGLSHRLGHSPGQLSTGERQRAALARALISSPQLILADEPTGNLDAENARAVLQYLADLTRNGAAVVLVTHDPQAASFAQRTVFLLHGQLQAEPAIPSAT